ncbi:MAG: FecR domain-containing protein [Bacteroidales bacterium]|nr:FecR domain-containing protein [Bacteroidales bacterium]
MITDPLLFSYLSGNVSKRQKRFILKWIQSDPSHKQHLTDLKMIWNSTGETGLSFSGERELAWKQVKEQIRLKNEPGKNPSRVPTYFPWMVGTAALILLVFGLRFFQLSSSQTFKVPAHNQAAVRYLLPDSSEVLLYPGSRLVIPAHSADQIRLVKLNGEAYFIVKNIQDTPFIVDAGGAKIRVTGTSFYVTSSPQKDQIEVVVESGKVLFYTSDVLDNEAFRVGLEAGEKGIYSIAQRSIYKINDYSLNSLP